MQNPGVLWFMIKKWQMAIKFRITIEESPGVIQKLLVQPCEAPRSRPSRRITLLAASSQALPWGDE
jgi:hypothetical protein